MSDLKPTHEQVCEHAQTSTDPIVSMLRDVDARLNREPPDYLGAKVGIHAARLAVSCAALEAATDHPTAVDAGLGGDGREADVNHDRAYRSGLKDGFDLGLRGDVTEYDRRKAVLSDEIIEARIAAAATPLQEGEPEAVAWPDVCDGVEQYAFEAWAAAYGYDMGEHPLHYLFLDAKTDAARQGWKAGLSHAVERMRSTRPAQPDREEVARLLEDFGKRTDLELSYQYGDEDEVGRGWTVHQVSGGRNDREWTVRGFGDTPRDAIAAALSTPSAQPEKGDA